MVLLSTADEDIKKAAAALAAGSLVAFPTETVYGLGADAFNTSALARIFEVKNRPRFDPLIIHIAEKAALHRIAEISLLSETAKERLSILSERLWPGPLTLILPKKPELPDLATAGLASAAVRFPSHPIAQKLIRLSTGAIAAPSANPFGRLSPTSARHVETQLGRKVDFIIDGGKTQVGLESTVLDLCREKPAILRPGGTSRESIEALIGPVEFSPGISGDSVSSADGSAGNSAAAQLSPGRLKSHYAPRTPLVLCRAGELASLPYTAPGGDGEGRLYFAAPGRENPAPQDRTRILSKTGDLREAAANLFEMLHELDGLGLTLIRAEEAPESGLGEAVNDRLRRAENRPENQG